MTAPSPPQDDRLEQEIARVRDANLLGRPGKLSRLFDFLAERSLAGGQPNENEIALEVFGRSSSFESGQDAVVRVYIHRLRKRLEDFYLKSGEPQGGGRLVIPRGEYRLVLAAAGEATEPADEAFERPATPEPPLRRRFPRAAAVTVLAAVAAALVGWMAATGFAAWSRPSNQAFVGAPVWRAYRSDRLPLLIVVGDYYIFGQSDDLGNIERLVREFGVNSREDLYQHMMTEEGDGDRAVDLDLAYLPVSTAMALRAVAPLIAERPQSRVVASSRLNAQMLRDNDLLYIGYLSGLRSLTGPTFRESRLGPGASFDEIVDRQTGHRYISEASRPMLARALTRDYGYFSTFPGPAGNRITVLMGARDVGLAGVAEAMTDMKMLRRLEAMPADGALEALFEIQGGQGVNLRPRLIVSTRRDASAIWLSAEGPAEAED